MKNVLSISGGMKQSVATFSSSESIEILERNLAALVRANPDLPAAIGAAQVRDIQLQTAADGHPTGSWAGRRLASRHQPGEEATRLAAEVDLREAATVCVLGFGLGRHVEEIARRMGRTGLVIVLEPDVDLLKSVLARVDCSDWLAESNVLFVTNPEDRTGLVSRLAGMDAILMLGMRILDHPSSMARLEPVAEEFSRLLAEIAATARMTVVTTLGRSAETVGNLLSNIDHYALGSGIADLRGVAVGRLGVVVSAGPSLRRNIHLLAQPGIREQCVIVATQTTLKPLLEEGIAPHLVTALDYHEISTRFYEGITAADVKDTELIIDPKVNPAVPDAWPGRIRSIASSELDRFLGVEGGEQDQLEACATVAHLAYAVARHLGCDPVALIGQDLGFTDGLYYAPGTAIHEVWLPEMNAFNTIETMEWERIARHRGQLSKRTDVHGRTIYTDQQMLTYLQQFETRFRADVAQGRRIYDATEGGIRKEHAEPRSLEEILSEYGSGGEDIRLPRAEGSCTWNTKDVVRRLEIVRNEASEIAEASSNAHGIIGRMIALQPQKSEMNRLFKELGHERERVGRLQSTFKLVDMVNQAGVFRRLKADRRLDLSSELDEMDRQRAQLDRDHVNVQWTADAAEELTHLLGDSTRLLLEGVSCPPRRRAAQFERGSRSCRS